MAIEKKKRSPRYSKAKGSAFESQVVKELRELTGNDNIVKAPKALDNMKIDIYDPDNIMPCY